MQRNAAYKIPVDSGWSYTDKSSGLQDRRIFVALVTIYYDVLKYTLYKPHEQYSNFKGMVHPTK